VPTVAKDPARNLERLCDYARESTSATHFDQRFADDGNASKAVKAIKDDIVSLIAEVAGSAPSNASFHEFLAHFIRLSRTRTSMRFTCFATLTESSSFSSTCFEALLQELLVEGSPTQCFSQLLY
jgi:hypothetical protein